MWLMLKNNVPLDDALALTEQLEKERLPKKKSSNGGSVWLPAKENLRT